MSKRNWMAAVALLSMTAMAGSVLAGTPNLDRREHNQRARIHQGVDSGELTRAEAQRLRVGQAHLHLNEARAKSDGVVTGAERARLQNQADRQSRRIHRQKHDAQSRG
jgi:hypothetical protein